MLSEAHRVQFNELLNDMEYLAWLFEQGYVRLPGAAGFWGPAMRCDYDFATLFYQSSSSRDRLPNLKLFVQDWSCASTPG